MFSPGSRNNRQKFFREVFRSWNRVRYQYPARPLSRRPRISFCTTCMGRLHHLKKTYLKNIEDNRDYPDLEFVLLNYSSPDGMDDWVREELLSFLDSGRVKYYKTSHHACFHMAHAKNVAHKLASGDIVCNLDADNFTGKGFAEFLSAFFFENKRSALYGNWKVWPGTAGRVAVLKKHFLLIRGYDESLDGWGFEDRNFMERLYNLGLRKLFLEKGEYLNVLAHDNVERAVCYPEGLKAPEITLKRNRQLSAQVWSGQVFANQGSPWGRDRVTMNFGEKVVEV